MSRRRSFVIAGAAAAVAYGSAARRDRARVVADPARDDLNVSLDPVTVRTAAEGAVVAECHGPADAPVVVLVHGWVCSARFWTRQIQALRADHRVIAYDARGHGRSAPAADGNYSIEALADDLEAVIAECVPHGRRFMLAGHSLGAMTIVAWAARHETTAERLAAAALINTGIGGLVEHSRVAPLPARLGALQRAVGPLFLAAPGRAPGGAGPISHRAVRHVAMSPQASPAEVAFCEEMVLECPAPTRAGCGRTLAGLDLWWSLPSLKAPTVVVAGERDRLTPPSHARRIAADLPCAVGLVELEGTGHMGPVEAAPRVTEVIRGLAETYVRRGAALNPQAEPLPVGS